MKKTLLSAIAVCGMFVAANAQSFTNGATGYLVDYYGAPTDTDPSCLNGTTGTGGYASAGANNNNVGTVDIDATHTALEFNSTGKTIDPYATVAWYDLYYTKGSGATAACKPLSGNDGATTAMGVDMSANYTVKIIAKASTAGAKLDIFLGASDKAFYPQSSTYNTGAASNNSITKTITLTTSFATYTVDFSADVAEKAIFDAWTNRTMVNQIGFRAQTADVTYDVAEIALGSANVVTLGVSNPVLPTTVSYYPNPSNSVINVENINVSTLKLMNTSGAVVKEVSGASSISVEGLNQGLYFLQINEFKPVKVTVQ